MDPALHNKLYRYYTSFPDWKEQEKAREEKAIKFHRARIYYNRISQYSSRFLSHEDRLNNVDGKYYRWGFLYLDCP